MSPRSPWRGAEPSKLAALVAKVRSSFDAQIIIAAAHGPIMAALLLAESRTACTIRHGGSSISPDSVGKLWWD